MHKWFNGLILGTGLFALGACSSDDANPNLVEKARSNSELMVLVEAVEAADLTATLSGPGPLTLFAPTDSAFATLLAELGLTKAQLLSDKELLTKVLTYHVLSRNVTAAEVIPGKAITSVQGGFFKVDIANSDLVITDGRNRTSKIIAADILASNGVIHLVDKVLLPADKTIPQTAASIADFSILVEALLAADLVETLSGSGPFTVFAPTNLAFEALLSELGITKAQLLADTVLLTRVLTYHVLVGAVLKADVPVDVPVTTLQGDSFTVDTTLSITDQLSRKASITATDVLNSNGVIHVVDKVLLPTL
jgi:uncharacterized surface protein with fasciclin (FAS1) repeats